MLLLHVRQMHMLALVNDLLNPCEVSLQVLMDVSHDPCTTEQVT
ncbi:Protein of unknown function [Gryllus bimaculatus]|nr:Protein of unknown function [Gryllus bimaculatus]